MYIAFFATPTSWNSRLQWLLRKPQNHSSEEKQESTTFGERTQTFTLTELGTRPHPPPPLLGFGSKWDASTRMSSSCPRNEMGSHQNHKNTHKANKQTNSPPWVEREIPSWFLPSTTHDFCSAQFLRVCNWTLTCFLPVAWGSLYVITRVCVGSGMSRWKQMKSSHCVVHTQEDEENAMQRKILNQEEYIPGLL